MDVDIGVGWREGTDLSRSAEQRQDSLMCVVDEWLGPKRKPQKLSCIHLLAPLSFSSSDNNEPGVGFLQNQWNRDVLLRSKLFVFGDDLHDETTAQG